MKKKILIITFVLLVALVIGIIFIKQEKEHTIKPKIESKEFNYEKEVSYVK